MFLSSCPWQFPGIQREMDDLKILPGNLSLNRHCCGNCCISLPISYLKYTTKITDPVKSDLITSNVKSISNLVKAAYYITKPVALFISYEMGLV